MGINGRLKLEFSSEINEMNMTELNNTINKMEIILKSESEKPNVTDWNLVQITRKTMILQLNITNPLYVSIGDSFDLLDLKFIN
jgi:hypothetical protein